MKKALITILALFVLSLFIGCNSYEPLDDSKFYKLTPIPPECDEYRGDECNTFSCMVPNCWCESGPDRILKQGGGMMLNESQAEGKVIVYLTEQGLSTKDYTITNTVQLNGVFFNIFVEINGDEQVFTVASNGTIMKTQCGV